VWVEIEPCGREVRVQYVTPFGECGLKFGLDGHVVTVVDVTPFGECGLKSLWNVGKSVSEMVTPFGECGLKFNMRISYQSAPKTSLPSGSVG